MEKHKIEGLSARIGRYTDVFTKEEILVIQKGLTIVALGADFYAKRLDETDLNAITLAQNNTIDCAIRPISVDHGILHKETKHNIQRSFTYDENQY